MTPSVPTVLPRAPGVTCLTLITTLFALLQTRKQRLREVPGLAKVTQLGNQELGLPLGWPDPTAPPALSCLCALEPPGSCCPESPCSQFHILFHTEHLESEAGNAGGCGRVSGPVRGAFQTQGRPSLWGMLRKEQPHLDSAQGGVGTWITFACL